MMWLRLISQNVDAENAVMFIGVGILLILVFMTLKMAKEAGD